VHHGFHISQLRKYVHNPTHAIVYEPLEVEAEGLTHKERPAEGLTHKERPVKIIDQRVKQLGN